MIFLLPKPHAKLEYCFIERPKITKNLKAFEFKKVFDKFLK